jgi:hypothetical protein
MKRALSAIALIGALSCCTAPQPTAWSKSGASQPDLDGDSARCNVQAWQQVPAYQQPSTPVTGYSSSCTGSGAYINCQTQPIGGGNNAPLGDSGWFTRQQQDRDRVESVRNSAFLACMYDRGWTINRANASSGAGAAPRKPIASLRRGEQCAETIECDVGLYCSKQSAVCE